MRVGRSAVAAVGLLIATASVSPGGVVTKRLGTGLVASRSASGLPQAWVAPAEAAPTIDGRLDDPVWAVAQPAVLGKLRSLGKAKVRTTVRFAHRDRVLYLAIELAEPNIGKLKRTVTTLDGPAYRDDSVELFISPYPARGYFQFIFAAGGGIYDRVGHGQAGGFNAGAKSAVVVGKDRWTLEIAIPMAPMGVGKTVPVRWRANVYRNHQADGGGNQALSPTFRSDYDVPEKFGYLLFTPRPPWEQQAKTAAKQSGIKVSELEDGGAVLQFDLSALPVGARIHRARLLCERGSLDRRDPLVLKNIEIYALAAAFEEGKPPKAAGKPLALAGPWFRSFEMTELVAAWRAGRRPNHGLHVKSFPAWRVERTFLDVMLDGPDGEVPRQVTGLHVAHRGGQTFLTFREIDDPVGKDDVAWGELKSILENLDVQRQVRYCVYRSREPITPQTIGAAERIAVVPPLSCWNINGRNIDRPVDIVIATRRELPTGQWNPFGSARADGDFGLDCPVERLVIRDGEKPLARGTGLYVHTAAAAGRFHYAVVTCVNGVENLAQITSANSTRSPVAETPADPQPVGQGELPQMPLFNYAQRRLHYVRWVGPPYVNLPSEYYNWSIGVPEKMPRGAAVELSLHRDGHSYWRTQYRIERDSLVLSPHDFPVQTFWYGYHESLGTLRSMSQGVIRAYTERRLLSFLKWAQSKWRTDANRVLVTGSRGGGSGGGALHLGLRHPDVFNLVISGHGEPHYGENHPASKEMLWGRLDWNLPTEAGKGIWDELNLIALLKRTPPAVELPVVALTFSHNSRTSNEFCTAMLNGGRAILASFSWGGTRYLPVSRTHTSPTVIRLDVRKNRSLPAFRTAGGLSLLQRRRMGAFNTGFRWRTADLVDEPDRYEVTLFEAGRGKDTGDVTLRRLQKLRVAPGATFVWAVRSLDGAETLQKGEVTVGADGLLTIPQVAVAGTPVRLVVTRK